MACSGRRVRQAWRLVTASGEIETRRSFRPLPWTIWRACCVQSICSIWRWTTPEHEQEEGFIHGVVDLRTQPLHLVLREGFGQGPAPAYHVTRCNRVTYDAPLLNQRVKEMFQRMQAPMERRGGEPLVVLPVH